MNVTCTACQTVFRVDPDKVPAAGVRARCSVCSGVFWVRPGALAAAPAGFAPGGVREPAAPPAWEVPPPLQAPVEPAPAVHPRPRPPAPPPPAPAAGRPPGRSAMPPPVVAPVGTGAPPSVSRSLGRPAGPVIPPRPVTAPTAVRPAAPPPAEPRSPHQAAKPPTPPPPAPVQARAVPPAQPVSPPAAPPRPATAPVPAPRKRRVNPFLSQDPEAKARRLARALISDMVVYHPAKRREGLQQGSLKRLFEDEIKKSWEEYVDQVGQSIAESTPFFNEALNEILADGQVVFP